MQLPFDGEHYYGLKGFVHDICAKCYIYFCMIQTKRAKIVAPTVSSAGAGDGRMELRSGMRLPDDTAAEDFDNGRSSVSG